MGSGSAESESRRSLKTGKAVLLANFGHLRDASSGSALARGEREGSYVPGIDGLRALAVLSVMLFHLRPGLLPGGFVGVDVFFVISGFVVTKSLADRQFESLGDLLSYFYVRRILRIIPALLVVLIISVILFVTLVPASWLSSTSARVAKGAFLGVSNIVLAFDTEDYFAPRPGFNPFTHTWSLGVEEQFYLIFPFLLFWHLRHKKAGGHAVATIGAIAALSVASFITCAWMTLKHWPWAFYLMPARLWELGMGMFLCLTIHRWRPIVARLAPPWRIVLACTSVVTVVIDWPIVASTSFPFPLALFPAIGSLLFIAQACALPHGKVAQVLSSRLPVAIGKRSYSLYLWHWPTFVFLRWTVGIESLLTAAIGLLLTFGAAELSYRFVELGPLRQRIARTVPRWMIIAGGLSAIAAIGGAAKITLSKHNMLSLSRTAQKGIWYPDGSVPLNSALTHCAIDQKSSAFSGGKVRRWIPISCSIPRKPGRLFVIGDSHSLAYMPMLRQYAADTGREVRSYHLSDCPYVNLKNPIGRDATCSGYYAALSRMLRSETARGDVVFLASLKVPRFSNQWGPLDPRDARQSSSAEKRQAAADLTQLASMLRARRVNIIVEGTKPIFRSPAFRCVDWFNRSNPICKPGLTVQRSEMDKIRAPIEVALANVAKKNPNVVVWGPFDQLCPGQQCTVFHKGKPLFIDGDHLSAYANELLYPSFRDRAAIAFGDR